MNDVYERDNGDILGSPIAIFRYLIDGGAEVTTVNQVNAIDLVVSTPPSWGLATMTDAAIYRRLVCVVYDYGAREWRLQAPITSVNSGRFISADRAIRPIRQREMSCEKERGDE